MANLYTFVDLKKNKNKKTLRIMLQIIDERSVSTELGGDLHKSVTKPAVSLNLFVRYSLDTFLSHHLMDFCKLSIPGSS